ncbi:MAG: hypothetical protein ACLFTT_02370 [Candidatus Hydrogenedentota bacterium]
MLTFLGQATNPLAPLSTLLKHCRQIEGFDQLDQDQLLYFLRHHDLVKVIEPAGGIVGELAEMADAGQLTEAEPRIVLKERIPPPQELAKLMIIQLETVIETIRRAREEVRQSTGDPRQAQFEELLARAEELRTKLKQLMVQ